MYLGLHNIYYATLLIFACFNDLFDYYYVNGLI